MIHIVDTTLRDGEQSPGLAFTRKVKVEIAKLLDSTQVYQIEAGVPALGKVEKEAISEIKASCKHALVSAWNRANIADIAHSFDCRPDIIHISIPVSKMHIYEKLQRNEGWLKQQLTNCVALACDKGYKVTVGFEDASRADMGFIIELTQILQNLTVKRIRFADTVGILTPYKTAEMVKHLLDFTDINIEFHAHNDLGMAVANSLAAAKAGAQFVDTTLAGIGERTGNCDFARFIEVTNGMYRTKTTTDKAKEVTLAAENFFNV